MTEPTLYTAAQMLADALRMEADPRSPYTRAAERIEREHERADTDALRVAVAEGVQLLEHDGYRENPADQPYPLQDWSRYHEAVRAAKAHLPRLCAHGCGLAAASGDIYCEGCRSGEATR